LPQTNAVAVTIDAAARPASPKVPLTAVSAPTQQSPSRCAPPAAGTQLAGRPAGGRRQDAVPLFRTGRWGHVVAPLTALGRKAATAACAFADEAPDEPDLFAQLRHRACLRPRPGTGPGRLE